ncbi:hypothetical protein NQ317_006323 [Molorchus minor]|uniref:DDE Tnp4 domain-containing protein n=1 Tax=Molorchus minor TaxID=1323400 RepID=A0ABQ9IVW2_9CUCU|nr:hypothetical protein NQ317_006323 [Molorchus minor]
MSRQKRAIAAALIIAISRKQRRERTRKRIWIKEWIARRPALGAYTMLLDELRSEDPKQLKNFLRMSETDFNFLLQCPLQRKSGRRMQNSLRKMELPHCVGALDGKHIVIQAPLVVEVTTNYKGTHSIVLMALADANYKIIYANIGANGRISDGGVFNNCGLSTALEENTLNLPPPEPLSGCNKPVPYVVVADDAFALKPHLMKPYPFRNQPGINRVYNYRLSRARRIVENVLASLQQDLEF